MAHELVVQCNLDYPDLAYLAPIIRTLSCPANLLVRMCRGRDRSCSVGVAIAERRALGSLAWPGICWLENARNDNAFMSPFVVLFEVKCCFIPGPAIRPAV